MESIPKKPYKTFESRPSTFELADNLGIDTSPPKDHNNIVYFALLSAGIGFVLPYNSFVIAADYWQARFPGHAVTLDISLTYTVTAFCTVLMSNILLSLISFRKRIVFGYFVSLITLIFVTCSEVAWHMFSTKTAYIVNLVAVSILGIGCTIKQSSFYGLASMLPRKYTQAAMAGESLAGFLVSCNRVITKILVHSDRASTVIFFVISTLFVMLSYILYRITVDSSFLKYYMTPCSKVIFLPGDDHSGESADIEVSIPKYSTQEDSTFTQNNENILSFSNPVYEISNSSRNQVVLERTIEFSEISNLDSKDPLNVSYKADTPKSTAYRSKRLESLIHGIEARWKIVNVIYPYMVCITLAYCITLSLYPGIESEIVSCNLGSWMPVLLMFSFNCAEVIGKFLAVVPYMWSKRQLILLSGLRVVLVPLLLLCAAPRSNPVIAGETAAFIFTIAFGASNGLAGSLPMILAPTKLPAALKEVAGNMMTLSYNVGSTSGSLIGYVFESMLGEPLVNPCLKIPNLEELSKVHGGKDMRSSYNITSTIASAVLTTYTTLPKITSTPTALSTIASITTTTASSSSFELPSTFSNTKSTISLLFKGIMATVATTQEYKNYLTYEFPNTTANHIMLLNSTND